MLPILVLYFYCEGRGHKDEDEKGIDDRKSVNILNRLGDTSDWATHTIDFQITRPVRIWIQKNLIYPMRSYMAWKFKEDKILEFWRSKRLFRKGLHVVRLGVGRNDGFWEIVDERPSGSWIHIKRVDESRNNSTGAAAEGTGAAAEGKNRQGVNESDHSSGKDSEKQNKPVLVRLEQIQYVAKRSFLSRLWDKYKTILKAILLLMSVALGIIVSFIFSGVKMAFNVYIIVASWYGYLDRFESQLERIETVIANVFSKVRIPFIGNLYNDVLWILSKIKLDIDIGVNVTCHAARGTYMYIHL